MRESQNIEQFLNGKPIAVAGASTNRSKYGNMVLRCLIQNNIETVPINPLADEVESQKSFKDLTEVGKPIHAVSIITPPKITEQVVKEAIALGIRHIWMQPGAESQDAVSAAVDAGLNVISGGPCILVVLGFRDE